MVYRAIYAVVERDIVKLFRQKGRVLSALVRPLIWLFVIGAGFESLLVGNDQNYVQFLVPGVVGMAILFGALLGALSTVYEKESGVMRLLVIAPIKRRWVVFAKMAAATVSSFFQVVLLSIILFMIGKLSLGINWPLFFLAVILLSITCSGIGMLVAVFSETLDNFAAIMNFVIFPIFFLSGSLYPVDNLPGLLGIIAEINPYTYGVDLLKHAILVPLGGKADINIFTNIAVLVIFSIFSFIVCSWRFSNEEIAFKWFPQKIKKS